MYVTKPLSGGVLELKLHGAQATMCLTQSDDCSQSKTYELYHNQEFAQSWMLKVEVPVKDNKWLNKFSEDDYLWTIFHSRGSRALTLRFIKLNTVLNN